MSKNDASHDIHHVDAVVKHAYNITKEWVSKTEKEVNATLLTALCHELCDKKYVPNTEYARDEMCRAIEYYCNVDADTIKMIHTVVPYISFSRRVKYGIPDLDDDCLKVYLAVSDADYLESLGAIGVVRTFIYQAIKYQDSDNVLYGANIFIKNNLIKTFEHLENDYAKKEGECRLARIHRICHEIDVERGDRHTKYLSKEFDCNWHDYKRAYQRLEFVLFCLVMFRMVELFWNACYSFDLTSIPTYH